MDLKTLFHIQEVLQDSGYSDLSRISKEILEYSEQEDINLDDILSRIEQQEPWEYIRGYAEFKERIFFVTKDTLIPRIESEQLVDIAIDLIEKEKRAYKQIPDIGTGSGCLIISLILELEKKGKDFEYIATDISRDTLAIARKNAHFHSIDKIRFLERDLIKGNDIKDKSLIIANLPYIPLRMYEDLDNSVKGYEPKIALEGGEDGLLHYRRLIEIITDSKKDIDLLIEIEPSTIQNFKKIVSKNQSLKIFKDFRGKERFLFLHFS